MVVIKAASRVGSHLIRLSAIAMVAAVSLTGCTSTQYMGISLRPGANDPTLQELAAKAQGGDKQSQYELGRWFEGSADSNGWKKAIKLYEMAAKSRGGSQLIFFPSPTGVSSKIVSTGEPMKPLAAAQKRLNEISSEKNRTKAAINNYHLKEEFLLRQDEFTHVRLKYYPNRELTCPFFDDFSLSSMYEIYILGSSIALPLSCIFPNRVAELASLADTGNQSAQLLIATLLIEVGSRSESDALKILEDLSKNGFGPASIVVGIYREKNGDINGARENYELAGRQGIVNYTLYIRELDKFINPVVEK